MLKMASGVADKTFDHMSAMTSYVITPLTFLSGTFYSTNSLPEFWRNISHFNPFFYMIDGFRYGFFGQSDISPWISLAIVSAFFVVLATIAVNLLKRGYNLRH